MIPIKKTPFGGSERNRDKKPRSVSGNTGFSTPSPGTGYKSTRPNSSVVFVNDAMEFKEYFKTCLSESTQVGTVTGIIGLQGSGKSTLLSMLAGNQTHEKFRQYIFRACTRDAVDAGFYQTEGISVYVTESRNIFVDCRAFNSGAVLEEYAKKNRNDKKAFLKTFLTDDLTLLSTMLEICHNVIFSIDWFIDVNAVQEILRASLFSEFNFRKHTGYPKTTNLVVVHQRAKTEDFEPSLVKKRAALIKNMFKESSLNVNTGVSMAGLGFKKYSGCEDEINYVVMDEMMLWGKDHQQDTDFGRVSYVDVLNTLKLALMKLPQPAFRMLGPSRSMRVSRSLMFSSGTCPTVDKASVKSKKVADFTDETKQTDDNIIFHPDQLPNITSFCSEQISPEPSHDLDSIIRLSVPPTIESAQNMVKVFYLSSKKAKDDSFISSLLPQSNNQRFTEVQWSNYAKQIYSTSQKAFHDRYFLTNNGRLAPKLIRKLKAATRFIYVKESTPVHRAPAHLQKRGTRGKYSDRRGAEEGKETGSENESELSQELTRLDVTVSKFTGDLEDSSDESSRSESSVVDSDSSNSESEEEEKPQNLRQRRQMRRRAASDSS